MAIGNAAMNALSLTDSEELWVERVVDFSSEYNTSTWSANSVVGPPRVYPRYGDIHGAWAQGNITESEFIIVAFAEKLYIESIEIYETLNAGAVVRVSACRPDSEDWVTLWQAADSAPQLIQSSRCFSPPVADFDFPSNCLKLELNCTAARSWCEIDAIKIRGRRMLCPKEPPMTELSHDMRTLVNCDLFSDVTFEVEGHRVFAHRAVLAARSKYFHTMFCGGLREACNNSDQVVEIKEMSFDSFIGLLQFIYTNDFDDSVSPLQMVELIRVGDRFSLGGMKTLSFHRLCSAIDVNNVIEIYREASENLPSLDHVERLCLRFIASNLDRVTKVTAFCQLPQQVMLRIIQDATDHLSISK